MSKQLSKGKRRNNFEKLESPKVVDLYREHKGYGGARIEVLMEILRTMRPHGSKAEKKFCRDFLDVIPGMESDGFGNRIMLIPGGDKNPKVCWTSHVDTVHRIGGTQVIRKRKDIITLGKGSFANCLGADDGAGVWLMIEMIRAEKPGLYIFHRGEECGGLGSDFIRLQRPKFLDTIEAMISLDRFGYHSVITHQMGMTASDDFALSVAKALPGFDFEPDETGLFTDSANYADIIPECSNLSVGYFSHHTAGECLDMGFVCALLESLINMDYNKLVISRVPGDDGYEGYGYGWSSQAKIIRKDSTIYNSKESIYGDMCYAGYDPHTYHSDTATVSDVDLALVTYDHEAGVAYVEEQDHISRMEEINRADAETAYDLDFEKSSFARLLRDNPETCAVYLINIGITIDELFHNLEHTSQRG